jgi:hypothetical protein
VLADYPDYDQAIGLDWYALEEATFALARDNDARKAAVARRFVTRRLAEPPLRGLLDTDRTVLDHFEELIRSGALDPGVLAA